MKAEWGFIGDFPMIEIMNYKMFRVGGNFLGCLIYVF